MDDDIVIKDVSHVSIAVSDMDRSIADIAAKVHPSIPLNELGRRTVSGRDFRQGELWYQVDQAQ
jgi:hypothetical protein